MPVIQHSQISIVGKRGLWGKMAAYFTIKLQTNIVTDTELIFRQLITHEK